MCHRCRSLTDDRDSEVIKQKHKTLTTGTWHTGITLRVDYSIPDNKLSQNRGINAKDKIE